MKRRIPRRRLPEQVGGDVSHVSNRSTYRAEIRQENVDRKSRLLAKIVMVSVVGTFMVYLAVQFLR